MSGATGSVADGALSKSRPKTTAAPLEAGTRPERGRALAQFAVVGRQRLAGLRLLADRPAVEILAHAGHQGSEGGRVTATSRMCLLHAAAAAIIRIQGPAVPVRRAGAKSSAGRRRTAGPSRLHRFGPVGAFGDRAARPGAAVTPGPFRIFPDVVEHLGPRHQLGLPCGPPGAGTARSCRAPVRPGEFTGSAGRIPGNPQW